MRGVSRFDCYPSDFLNGIIGLTADQIAAYTVVMMLQYDRGEPVQYVGRERELSVRTGLPKGRLSNAVDDLLGMGKICVMNGALYNARAAEELQKIAERIAKNAENSHSGGEATRKKWGEIRNENNQEEGRPASRADSQNKALLSPPPPLVELASASSKRTPKSILLECLSLETAEGVIAHRKAKKAPLTELAARELVKGFLATGDPEDAAKTMVARGWQGFKPSWYENDKSGRRDGKLSVQDAAKLNHERGIDFGPVPAPYLPQGRSVSQGRDSVVLLPEGGRGRSGDLRGSSGVGPVLLSTEPIAYRDRRTPRTGIAGKSQWLPTVAEVRAACEAEMAPSRALEASQRRREETQRCLASPEAGRVSEARWKDLADAIGPPPDKPTISPKSEEWLREYGHKPLIISDELRAKSHQMTLETAPDEETYS